MDFKVKQITTEETYLVRHPILRAGKPLHTCYFDGDNLESTFHLGLFKKKHLIGVSTFMKNKHELLKNSSQYQLRGMAILKEFQGLGLGNLLLEHAEGVLKQKKAAIIWCNAREIAKKFYQRNGYEIIGTPFNIADIGRHFVMFKTL